MSKGKQVRTPILADFATGQYITFPDMASAKKYQTTNEVNVGVPTQIGYLIGHPMVLKRVPVEVNPKLKLVPVTGMSVEPGPNVDLRVSAVPEDCHDAKQEPVPGVESSAPQPSGEITSPAFQGE